MEEMVENPKRSRGTRLTKKGMRRLIKAKRNLEEQANNGCKYTTEDLSDSTGLTSRTITKVFSGRENVDRKTIHTLFSACNLEMIADDLITENQEVFIDNKRNVRQNFYGKEDWIERISASSFYGRTDELTTLTKWVVPERCRLVTITGLSGIGKTALLSNLLKHIRKDFEYVFWQPVQDILDIHSFSNRVIQSLLKKQEIEKISARRENDEISQLIYCLKKHRCLLLLDSTEAILCNNDDTTEHCLEYEYYSRILRRVGEALHQSCVVLTTCEKPKEVSLLESNSLPVRSYRLRGLDENAGQKILVEKSITASEVEVKDLMKRYGGNPLAVKAVSATICNVFDGSVSNFLKQNMNVFGDVRIILDKQFKPLSDLDKTIIGWLATKRKPCSFSELVDIPPPLSRRERLLERLDSLTRKSLVEVNAGFFFLQPVILEYANVYFSEKIFEEIMTERPFFLKHYRLASSYSSENGNKHIHSSSIADLVVSCLLTNVEIKSNVDQFLAELLLKVDKQQDSASNYTVENIASFAETVALRISQ